MPVSTPISLTVGPTEEMSVFSGQSVGLLRSSCRSEAAYAPKLRTLLKEITPTGEIEQRFR